MKLVQLFGSTKKQVKRNKAALGAVLGFVLSLIIFRLISGNDFIYGLPYFYIPFVAPISVLLGYLAGWFVANRDF